MQLLLLLLLLLPAPALSEQLTFGMAVCVHLGGCMGQHTASPVRSLSCSLAEWRVVAAAAAAAAAVVVVAVLGCHTGESVGIVGSLVCGPSLLLLLRLLLLLLPVSAWLSWAVGWRLAAAVAVVVVAATVGPLRL